MKPVEPKAENLAPGWHRVVYAVPQPEYVPLPALQDSVEYSTRSGVPIAEIPEALRGGLEVALRPERVVSVWEPDFEECCQLEEMVIAWRTVGKRPRISLMSHVFGQPLQPIRLTVGEFGEPYAETPPAPGPVDPPKNSHRPVG